MKAKGLIIDGSIPTKDKVCIGHMPCLDGFGSMWSCWRSSVGRDFDFLPGEYKPLFYPKISLDQLRGKEVVFVDFCFNDPDWMREIASVAKKVTVLDHHKTAQETVGALFDDNTVDGKFDMQHSGAMLTWQHFNPDEEPPEIIKMVQDRDLWKFSIDGCKDYNANLFSYPYDFETWDKLAKTSVDQIIEGGIPILRKQDKDLSEILQVAKRRMTIAGIEMWIANLPYLYGSDAAAKIIEDTGEEAAGYYYDSPEARNFGLRSKTGGSVDVGALAQEYGGGGHKHASGFTVPRDHELAKL